jgi:hypothetical protein
MARQRKRIPLEDGLKLDFNKLHVDAISQPKPSQLVICWEPRYSSEARTVGILILRFSEHNSRLDAFACWGVATVD